MTSNDRNRHLLTCDSLHCNTNLDCAQWRHQAGRSAPVKHAVFSSLLKSFIFTSSWLSVTISSLTACSITMPNQIYLHDVVIFTAWCTTQVRYATKILPSWRPFFRLSLSTLNVIRKQTSSSSTYRPKYTIGLHHKRRQPKRPKSCVRYHFYIYFNRLHKFLLQCIIRFKFLFLQERVTIDEERVLRGGWKEIRLWR